VPEKLVIVRGKHEGEEFDLAETPVMLGSGSDCGIRLTDPGVLEQHAVLEKEDGTWHVRAVDSSRQIESEGRLMMAIRMDHGTTFQLGHALAQFLAVLFQPILDDLIRTTAELRFFRRPRLSLHLAFIVFSHIKPSLLGCDQSIAIKNN